MSHEKIDTMEKSLASIKELIERHIDTHETDVRLINEKLDVIYPVVRKDMESAEFWMKFQEKFKMGGSAVLWLYRLFPTFIRWAIRVKHLKTGHYGFIHKSKKLPGEWKCTGENCSVANGTYTQRSGVSLTGSAAGSGAVKNVRGDTSSLLNGITRGKIEFVVGSGISTSLPNYPEFGPFSSLLDTGANPTTGYLVCGSFGSEVNRDIYDISGASVYTNNNGGMYIGTTGEYVIVKSYFSLRGIPSFQNVAPTVTGFATSGVDFTFRVANAGAGDWSSWQTLDGTNLSGCLAALTGFDSDLGFDIQIAMTATTDDLTRYITTINMPVNIDPTFEPEIGFARVGVSGAIVGTRIAAFTYPAGTFIGSTVLTSDEGYVNCPYGFVGGKETVTMRVRYPGYAPIVFNVEYNQLGNIVPITQVENKDIQGVAIYGRGTGATDALVDFDLANLRIDIGDGKVVGEDLYDLVCEYQATATGIQAPEILTFDGRDILLDPLSAGWRFRRWHTTDTNAGLDALPVVSGDTGSSPDDEINGSVDFAARSVRTIFSANDASAIADAVWAKPQGKIVFSERADHI